ncbi:MAG: hypothetical protein A2X86_01280 [Bdellovibrionales bacterium GWA2_49_15]|nr:MAG: hypothetical protein A2X86_01280 [Bdellovibrionales bacterium GWA2_49_15]HAZ12143.1 hypothetical protein [Bdellovibrionales bacterium]
METMSLESAQKVIGACLRTVLQAKKKRNQEWASRGSGVSKSTISNLLNEKSLLGPAPLLNIARFLLGDLNRPFLTPQEKTFLKKFLTDFEKTPLFKTDEQFSLKIERYLLEHDDVALRTFLLASHHAGVSAKELFDLGQGYLDHLGRFLTKKWVYEDSGRYHATSKQFYFKSHQLTRRLAILAASSIRPDLWNKATESGAPNFCMIINESLTGEAAKEIVADLVRVTDKIEKFIQDPTKKGPVHLVFLGLLESLTHGREKK